MMLYLFAPGYMELIKRHPIYHWLPVVMIMWCILVQYVTPIHQAVGHLEDSSGAQYQSSSSASTWARWCARQQSLDGASIWMIWMMFLMTLASSIFLEQETPRHVSSLLGAHALHSPYHYEHSAAQPYLPPHSPMVQPRLHLW